MAQVQIWLEATGETTHVTAHELTFVHSKLLTLAALCIYLQMSCLKEHIESVTVKQGTSADVCILVWLQITWAGGFLGCLNDSVRMYPPVPLVPSTRSNTFSLVVSSALLSCRQARRWKD